jgi:dephospho-CoA kinase
MKIVSIVGMAGAGKSEVSRIFEQQGFKRIRFGDLTDHEVRRRGLELNEQNERQVREALRKEHGMAAYAELKHPAVDAALKTSDVVIDGLYSWEEYLFLKEHYGENFYVVAIWSSPKMRYARLNNRRIRGLTGADASSRDRSEIENVNKGGPIAMADFTIVNNGSLTDLRNEVTRIIAGLKNAT